VTEGTGALALAEAIDRVAEAIDRVAEAIDRVAEPIADIRLDVGGLLEAVSEVASWRDPPDPEEPGGGP
jgi:methyl-accepting chemotaxis protein